MSSTLDSPILTAAIEKDLAGSFTITDEHRDFYRENGYIKLKQVLSPETIQFYGDVITDQVIAHNAQQVPLEERDTYGKAFLQVMNLWRHSELVKQFVYSKKLAQIATDLMGCTGVRLYHDQALYKEPGGGHTPWHADQFYWPIDSNNTVTVWVPLQETPLELGPLAFAPKSHLVKRHRDLAISDESERLIEMTVKETIQQLVETAFDIGEVSYHAGWTFHRAGANTTQRPRRVMTVIYFDQNATLHAPQRKEHENDWNTWMPGVEIGKLIDSPINPVLYSH